jgi:flagellar FliL protein
MAANRMDASGSGAASLGGGADAPGSVPTSASSPAGGGGLAAWLPLLVTLVAMPVLAFTTTQFLLLPKLQPVTGATAVPADGEPSTSAPAASPHSGGGSRPNAKSAAGNDQYMARIDKVLVNVAGSMGSRYLMVRLTLVSKKAEIKELVKAREDQLVDLASSALSSKTITELDTPGARNLIRSELLSLFNNALGGGLIQEIYFTEFAIQ